MIIAKQKAYYDCNTATDSSAIMHVYYDNASMTMYVVFPSGAIAGYSGVHHNDYERLVGAESVGRHYAQFVRGVYRGLTGDVELVKREYVKTLEDIDVKKPNARKSYAVTIEMNGELKFTLDAESVEAAIKSISGLVDEAIVNGQYSILEVTRNTAK